MVSLANSTKEMQQIPPSQIQIRRVMEAYPLHLRRKFIFGGVGGAAGGKSTELYNPLHPPHTGLLCYFYNNVPNFFSRMGGWQEAQDVVRGLGFKKG